MSARAVTVPTALKPDDVSITNDIDDTVLRAWRDYYVAGHYWHPASDVSIDVWRGLIPPRTSVLRVIRDRIVGIAFMIADEHGPRFAGGAVARDDPDARGIAERLLTAAAGTTGGELDVELEDWLSEVWAVIETLPHEVIDEGHTIAETPTRP